MIRVQGIFDGSQIRLPESFKVPKGAKAEVFVTFRVPNLVSEIQEEELELLEGMARSQEKPPDIRPLHP